MNENKNSTPAWWIEYLCIPFPWKLHELLNTAATNDKNSVDKTSTMGLRSPSTAQFEQNPMRAAIRTKISRYVDSEFSCFAKRSLESREFFTWFNY